MRQDGLNFDFELFLMDAETGQHKIQLTHNDTDDACPDWSYDLRRIVFQHEKNGRWIVRSINLETEHQQSLVESVGWSIQPRWQKGQSQYVVPVGRHHQLPQMWGQLKKGE